MRQKREIKKSKPVSIRYNIERYNAAIEITGAETIQELVDYLIKKCVLEHKAATAQPIPKPMPISEPAFFGAKFTTSFDSYKAQIKDLETPEECTAFVKKVDGDTDLTWLQKKTLKDTLKAKFA